MMRAASIFPLLLVLTSATLWAAPAQAARVALVIGNSDYQRAKDLNKTSNDARDMAAALRDVGFALVGGRAHMDRTRGQMLDLARQFQEDLQDGDTAIFYFSGHGIGGRQTNYLLPVDDGSVRTLADVEDRAVDMNRVLERMTRKASGAERTGANIVSLDACRDSPLPSKSGTGGKGLVATPSPGNIGGTLILYAARPGTVAYESQGRHSYFTAGLLSALPRPGLDLRDLFRAARRYVRRETQRSGLRQEPWREGDLDETFYFRPRTSEQAAQRPQDQEPSRPPRENPRRPARRPFEPEMVQIPGGSFLMGSPENEEGRDDDEGPQHRVTVAAFEIGKYEVTWAEWEACVAGGGCDASGPAGRGGDEGWGKGRRPVINVTWTDAQAYISWLNSQVAGRPYRLPSEAEWEYAARAGTVTRFSWGDEDPVCDEGAANGANFNACPDDRTRPVGSFRANGFGLHNMHGNAHEWVQDCWNNSYQGAPTDGSAWTSGNCDIAVVRGGSWSDNPRFLRAANRFVTYRVIRSISIGFRVARTLPR